MDRRSPPRRSCAVVEPANYIEWIETVRLSAGIGTVRVTALQIASTSASVSSGCSGNVTSRAAVSTVRGKCGSSLSRRR